MNLLVTTKIGFYYLQRMHKMCCALLLPYQIEERKEIRKRKAKEKIESENTDVSGCDDALSIAVASTVLLQPPSVDTLQQQQQQQGCQII